MLPLVKNASHTNTKNRAVNAQSTARRKEGCNEEPGFRTKEKNPTSVDSCSDGVSIVKVKY